MGKGNNQIQETPQQRALADIGRQQLEDFTTRWQPHLVAFAKQVEANAEPGSYARRHATSMAGTDAAAKFAGSGDQALGAAAPTGTVGSARQKLAITGMAGDQATSTGLGAVAADQAVDNATVQGLGAVTALAKGEKASTVSGLEQSAALSGRQAAADAEQSLQNRMGEAGLASKIIGAGAGLWLGQPPKPPGTTGDFTRMDRGLGYAP